MLNLDDITNENNKKYNEKLPYVLDHLCRILLIGCSKSRKINTLLNLIKEQDNIDKVYLYANNLSEPKYQFLITKRENAGIKHLNDPEAFTECSNSMDDVYDDIDEYNATRKRTILIVLDDTIADIMSNKKVQAVVKELINRC